MELNRFIPLYVTYRCSKCGNTVVTNHIVRETTTATNNDTVVWQGTKEDFNNMDGKKELEPGRKIKKILAEEEKGLYRLAEFNCKCGHCNHVEPWSKMRYYIFDAIFGTFLPFAILLTLIAFPIGIWLLGVEALYISIKHLHRAFMENRIKQLPKLSLPCISLLPQESVELFKNKLANEKVEQKAKTESVVEIATTNEPLSENEKAKSFAKNEYDVIIKYWAQIYTVSQSDDLDESIKEQVISGLWDKIGTEKDESFIRKLKVFRSYINEDALASELNIVARFYNGEFK
jgi:hypothetical protein